MTATLRAVEMKAPEPQVHLAIGSRFENIELVQAVVEEGLKQLELDEDSSHWIGMAVREAVANAIKHGNQQDPAKRVSIDFGLEGDEVVIRVEDEGEGFDPESVPDPLSTENLLKPAGRGIFYMRRFMDQIDYTFRAEGGTLVTMRKRVLVPSEGARETQETEP